MRNTLRSFARMLQVLPPHQEHSYGQPPYDDAAARLHRADGWPDQPELLACLFVHVVFQRGTNDAVGETAVGFSAVKLLADDAVANTDARTSKAADKQPPGGSAPYPLCRLLGRKGRFLE